MMRSMFSGVAGLRNHQTAMDVIGANISNVNTVGYKGGRSNFSDVISQTMQGAASATGTRGGTNPIQIGLGMGLAAVDTIMTSGSYQPTGKQTDLAIQNQGFFIVSDGLNQYFTRAGNFDFDGTGNYVVPGTGLKVMGWLGVDGVVDTSGQVSDIVIPSGITLPAVATTSMTFINNLSGTDTPGSSAQTSLEVYDSLGRVQTLQQKFIKTDDLARTWLTKASLTDDTIGVSNPLTEITFDSAGKVNTVKQVVLHEVPSANLVLADGLRLSTDAALNNVITSQELLCMMLLAQLKHTISLLLILVLRLGTMKLRIRLGRQYNKEMPLLLQALHLRQTAIPLRLILVGHCQHLLYQIRSV